MMATVVAAVDDSWTVVAVGWLSHNRNKMNDNLSMFYRAHNSRSPDGE